MNDPDIAELERLRASATSGPWRSGADECHFGSPEVTDDKTFSWYITTYNDARFIAAAYNAMPGLIRRIRELEALQPKCSGTWLSGSGGHRRYAWDCSEPGKWNVGGQWVCDKHKCDKGSDDDAWTAETELDFLRDVVAENPALESLTEQVLMQRSLRASAEKEVEALKRRIADFDTDIIVHTSAVQERYEARLKTWKANHDQRKAERDALKADRDRVAELYDEACTGFSEMHAQRDSLLREVARLTKERDDARANARIVAHSYEHDCRPLPRAVKESLAYPVVPEGTGQ